MTQLRTSLRMTLALMLLAWVTGGCVISLDREPAELEESSVSLALSLKNVGAGIAQGLETKMTSTVTQLADGSFRGIEEVFVVPFNKTVASDAVVASDQRLGSRNVILKNPGIINSFGTDAQEGRFTGLVNNNNSRLYPEATMPKMMNRVLAYGKAIDDGPVSTKAEKHHNGLLTPINLDNPTKAGDILFKLESILIGGETGELSEITTKIDYILSKLNSIVTIIKTASDPQIPGLLSDLIHDHEMILACSYQTFYGVWFNINTALINLPPPDVNTSQAEREAYQAEREALRSAINNFNDAIHTTDSSFPSSYGIPEGTFGFWWNGAQFIRLISGVNIALVDPAFYCYPPCLWYKANSPIKTSNDESVKEHYVSDNDHRAWNDILSHYADGV